MVYTNNFLIFSRPKPGGGGVYIWNLMGAFFVKSVSDLPRIFVE